jgi:hypothetical protein
MKAKKVYEFKQGQDPYKTMEIGSNRPLKLGDKLKVKETFRFDFDTRTLYIPIEHVDPNSNSTVVYEKNKICVINDIVDTGYQLECHIARDGEERYWPIPGNEIKLFFERI